MPYIYANPAQGRLSKIGHAIRVEDSRIPKDIVYDELASGSRTIGRPKLHYRDVGERDMKALYIDNKSWETTATGRSRWCGALKKHMKIEEETI